MKKSQKDDIKRMNTKKIIILPILIVILIVATNCNRKEEDMIDYDIFDKAMFASGMYFLGTRSMQRLPNPIAEHFTKVVFFHSEEEADEFSEDVLVAWPGERTPRIVDGINWAIVRDEIDLEPFSLQYPITIKCLVDNWESVNELWLRGISSFGRVQIANDAWPPVLNDE